MNKEKQNTTMENLTAHMINKLREYEETPGMKELITSLNNIQNSYPSFVVSVATYAIKKPEHLKIVTDFIDSAESLTTSDLIRYISSQPDFFEDCVRPSAAIDNPEGADEAILE